MRQLLDEEIAAFAQQLGSKRIAPSMPPNPSVRDLRAAIDEVRRQRVLVSSILPLLTTLEQSAPVQLVSRSSEELAVLHADLTARVSACGSLLAEYDVLGQPPPSSFRSWSLERLRRQLEHLEAKSGALREVVALRTRLGGPRLDPAVVEWDEPTLRKYAAKLATKVAEADERKDKAVLLGKVEAALWQCGQDVPVALPTLTISELQDLYANLKARSNTDNAAVKVRAKVSALFEKKEETL